MSWSEVPSETMEKRKRAGQKSLRRQWSKETFQSRFLEEMKRGNEMQKGYDVGIILGHIYTGFGYTGRQKKRMKKGSELLKAGRVEQLMTTGGKGMWNKSAPSMAEVARDYLMQSQGIEASSILVEKESTTTYQNAEYALRLLQEQKLTSLILITSADHMPRARSIFLEVFPTDFELDFVISDYFCGIWSIIDFFWNRAGHLKRLMKPSPINKTLS